VESVAISVALYSCGDVVLSAAECYDISAINNDKYLFQNNLHTLGMNPVNWNDRWPTKEL